MRDPFVDEIHDILRGGAGKKDLGDAAFLECGDVRFGNDAAENHGNVVHAFLVEQAHKLRTKSVVRAGKDRESNDVDVFLHGRRRDHLRRLPQAGVDHLHAGIAQRAGNDLGAAVVPIQPRLRNEYADFLLSHSSSVSSVPSVVKLSQTF